MTRALRSAIHYVFASLLALSIISARPAMMMSHAMPQAGAHCGMSMMTHDMAHGDTHEHPSSSDHCSGMPTGACCDDCLCACIVESGIAPTIVAVHVEDPRPVWVADRPVAVFRATKSPSLRLPPPIGPPHSIRS